MAHEGYVDDEDSNDAPVRILSVKSKPMNNDDNNGTDRGSEIVNSRKGHCRQRSVDAGQPIVVAVRNANKSYEKGRMVLANFNMTVREGNIYGLLGASGCGKTTVLSCVVGRKKLNSGLIKIFGGVPGDRSIGVPGNRIGYMPQELALYDEFTAKETLEYFGRINEMDAEAVQTQIKFLLDLLNLSHTKTFIRDLSGGQKRRVSFAASLIHDADLYILDEPTVGVDPRLRRSIWNHLIHLTSVCKKTIIITTHYIEEAKQATVVGLMRTGRLLAEDSPNRLLLDYKLPTLEEVFLTLCVQEEDEVLAEKEPGFMKKIANFMRKSYSEKRMTIAPEEANMDTFKHRTPNNHCSVSTISDHDEIHNVYKSNYTNKGNNGILSLSKLWALMMKNFIRMSRNVVYLLFMFMLPALEIVLFCVAIGKDPRNLSFGIINYEVPSTIFTNESCPVVYDCDTESYFSCKYISHLAAEPLLSIKYYDSQEQAQMDIKLGNIWGIAEIPKNFSETIFTRMVSRGYGDEAFYNQSSIHITLDESNVQVTFVIRKSILESFQGFLQELVSECFYSEDAAKFPLIFHSPVYGSSTSDYTAFMAPGLIILIIYFLAIASTGEAFLLERLGGLLERSYVAGVTPLEYIIATLSTQFIVLLVQTLVTFIFTFVVFGIPCVGPFGWLIIIALLQGVAGMACGFLISTLCTDQSIAMQAAISCFYPSLLLSGILWPVEGMPIFLQKISWYLPSTAACQAMRDIMARGWGITSPSVYFGVIASSVWIALFIIACWVIIRFKN